MKMMLADCRVKATIDVIRGKWKAIIIKALKDRNLGYGELRRLLPEPSKKVLTDHPRELEKDRIISRSASGGKVLRTEYAITEYRRTLSSGVSGHACLGNDAQGTGAWLSKGSRQ